MPGRLTYQIELVRPDGHVESLWNGLNYKPRLHQGHGVVYVAQDETIYAPSGWLLRISRRKHEPNLDP